MIAGVTTVRDEADIIEATVRHLLNQGVDLIYVTNHGSTDGTKEILESIDRDTGRLNLFDCDSPIHMQQKWTDAMASVAKIDGCEWIIPFDADEFWIAPDGRKLKDVLSSTVPGISKLYASTYLHHDRDHRELRPKRFPKVAYRWEAAAHIHPGNHDVDGLSGSSEWSLLEIREIQYRSYEHFVAKMRKHVATLDPNLPDGSNWHHVRLADFSEEQLRAEWEAMCAAETVFDPIP